MRLTILKDKKIISPVLVPIIYCPLRSHPILNDWREQHSFNLFRSCSTGGGCRGQLCPSGWGLGWLSRDPSIHFQGGFQGCSANGCGSQLGSRLRLSDWSLGSLSCRLLLGLPTAWRLASETGSGSHWSCKNLVQKLVQCHLHFVSLVTALTEPTHIQGEIPCLRGKRAKKKSVAVFRAPHQSFLSFPLLFFHGVTLLLLLLGNDRNVGNYFSASHSLLSVSATGGGKTILCSQERFYFLYSPSLKRRSPCV